MDHFPEIAAVAVLVLVIVVVVVALVSPTTLVEQSAAAENVESVSFYKLCDTVLKIGMWTYRTSTGDTDIGYAVRMTEGEYARYCP